jgi:SAM-dependent methyltransferase
MNEKQKIEFQFWSDLFHSKSDYKEWRKTELGTKTKNFLHFKDQKGLGLDIGCGLVSILDDSGKDFIACDPLYDEYQNIVSFKGIVLDGENIGFNNGTFDWVLCVNVIDHTPNPQKMADEIYRILKPGGYLYLEVNFDDILSPAHYGLWDDAKVDEIFQKFTLRNHVLERNEADKQYLYHCEFLK